MPMLPFSRDEFAKLPRRSVTLLHERSGAPFKNNRCDSERLRKLISELAVQEAIANLVPRETILNDTNFSFRGLRKSACGYLVECGVNDSEIGEVLGISPERLRHYDKREGGNVSSRRCRSAAKSLRCRGQPLPTHSPKTANFCRW